MDEVVDVAQPSQLPPQYHANAFATNLSSQPQYNNGAFSPRPTSQTSQPQMEFTSSFDQPAPAYFTFSSPGPPTYSAGGFVQPPGYEEAMQQRPSGKQNMK